MATPILVDVDQKRAILEGKNVEASRIRIGVDIPTLDAKHREFLAKHINTKDLSLPSNGDTSYLTVAGNTQQDLILAIDEAIERLEQKWAETEARKKEWLDKTDAAYREIIENHLVEREHHGTVKRFTHEGKELTANYTQTFPRKVWVGPYDDEEFKKAVKAVVEKHTSTQEWQLLESDCKTETEKACAAAIDEAIANYEKKKEADKLAEEAKKEVLRMWMLLPNRDNVDMEMAEKGLIDKAQAESDILGFLFPERVGDDQYTKPDYAPEKADFEKRAFLAYRKAEQEAKAKLKTQMGDSFYTLDIPMDTVDAWNNVGHCGLVMTILFVVSVRSTRLNTVIIRESVEIVVPEE